MSGVLPFAISASGAGSLSPAPVLSGGQALSGRQKAAVIVRLLLSEGADVPLLALSDHDQTVLTEEFARMQAVDRDTLRAVVEEFCAHLERIGLSFPGGLDGALKMLEGRISDRAVSGLKRRAKGAEEDDPWDRVTAQEPDKLLAILKEESTEIAAVILSKLSVPKAADLLGKLPGERARQIARAISLTGTMQPQVVQRIGKSLVTQLEARPARAFDWNPAERMGAILNVSPAATRDDVLKGLDEEDQALAAEVRKSIFTFLHIPARLPPRDVPKVLRGVEQDVLVRALAGAKGEAEAVAEFILSNMSQRMAATIREEMAGAGRIKDRDAEAAQTAIVAAVREQADAGEVILILPEEAEDDG